MALLTTLSGAAKGLSASMPAFRENRQRRIDDREKQENNAFFQALQQAVPQGIEAVDGVLADPRWGQVSQEVRQRGSELREKLIEREEQRPQIQDQPIVDQARAAGFTQEQAAGLPAAGRGGRGLDAFVSANEDLRRREALEAQESEARLLTAQASLRRAGGGAEATEPSADTMSIVEAVENNPSLFDRLSSRQREEITPILARRGYEFPKPLSDVNIGKVSDFDTSLSVLRDTEKELQDKQDQLGPIRGTMGGWNPYDTEAQDIQASINVTKQIVGKALEGGVLRAEDEKKYARILPKLSDTPEVAFIKIKKVRRLLEIAREMYIKNLRAGKLDPSVSFDEIASSSSPVPEDDEEDGDPVQGDDGVWR